MVGDYANKQLAKERLGIGKSVNLKLTSLLIVQQDLKDKKLLCRIV
jgi:hypothetical protein